jgi:hypothetical protein
MAEVRSNCKPCRLCRAGGKLCKSHVIPEFVYSILYDKDHRFIEVPDVDKGIVRRGQKGYWERLLCVHCEARCNRFEKHARRLFFDPLPPYLEGSRRIREHPRLDYAKLKLFFLSVLWRASVSGLPVFRHVNLGAHDEKLREMLLGEDPGGPLDYSVLLFNLHFNGEPLRDYMVNPTPARHDGRRTYRFVFGGIVAVVFVSKQPPPPKLERFLMGSTPSIQSFDAELRDFAFLRNVWNRASQSTKDMDI